jgi:pyrroline-5-carboxylate reductase
MTRWQDTHIHIIGGGNMATALIGGLIADGLLSTQISVSDANAQARANLQALGVAVSAENTHGLASASVVILAVKPQVLRDVLAEIKPHWPKPHPLLLSIAAGIDVATLIAASDTQMPVVRAMPNTPALIQQGATVLFANACVSAQQRDLAFAIACAMGRAWWIDDEQQLDAVTAVSGSGPAYYFLLMEAMIDAAVALGLSADLARDLVLQTASGSAQLAVQRFAQQGTLPATLREQVTSPGGTTAAALNVLAQQQFVPIVQQAITAANDRAAALRQ